MNRRLLLRMVATALCGLVLSGTCGHAAELKVVTSVALTSVLNGLSPIFEQKTGHKLVIEYGVAPDVKKRVLDGERADVVILTRSMMEDLVKQNKLAPVLVDLAATPVSVVARANAPMPDIGSVDSFKQALLAARSIVYADPAKGAVSALVAARAIERLGIADQLKAKTILVPGAQAAELVAKGEAEIGIGQASEIVPVAGIRLVGPLPGELASTTLFTGGISADAPSPGPAKTLIEFLTGPVATPDFKAKGFKAGGELGSTGGQ